MVERKTSLEFECTKLAAVRENFAAQLTPREINDFACKKVLLLMLTRINY